MEADPDSSEIEAVVHSLLHILGYDSTIRSLDKTRMREEIQAGIRQYLGAVTKTQACDSGDSRCELGR